MSAASIRQLVVPLFLVACLVLGGSTRSHWPNALLQLLAILILAWTALSSPRVQTGRHGRALGLLAGIAIAIVALQLIPLPPSLWTALPGRGAIAHGFDLLGAPLPWMPLSLAPYDTLASALWFLPPLAILFGIIRLGAYRASWLTLAVLLTSFAGVLLGALQVTSGGSAGSHWYLYPITNDGLAVGFFANSNHMALLLVTALPFLVALYSQRRREPRRVQTSAGKIAILSGGMLIALIGIALSRSLAGIGLAIPVLALSLLVRWPSDQSRTRYGLAVAALIGLLSVGAMFATPLDNNLTTAGAERQSASRYTSFRNSLHATRDYLPVGSGLGSFPHVYPAYEDPAIVNRWFVNHVHNDYIELALETGLAGILLMLAFLLWWAGRAVAVWRGPTIDYFGRAASIASGAMLAHSMVEFPLRTSALAAVFAMCLGLMAGPRRRLAKSGVEAGDGDGTGPRHLTIE